MCSEPVTLVQNWDQDWRNCCSSSPPYHKMFPNNVFGYFTGFYIPIFQFWSPNPHLRGSGSRHYTNTAWVKLKHVLIYMFRVKYQYTSPWSFSKRSMNIAYAFKLQILDSPTAIWSNVGGAVSQLGDVKFIIRCYSVFLKISLWSGRWLLIFHY